MTRKRRRPAGHTSNGRGNLLIERTFPAPIGKMRISSGTKDPQCKRDIDEMLTAFVQSVPPRWDLVVAVRDGTIAPLYALALYRMNKLAEVPSAEVLPPLTVAYEKWAATLDVSDAYRAQIACTFRQLQTLGTEPLVADLPKLLQARREQACENKTPVGFNHNKVHVQAFVKALVGDDHPLYRAVTKVPRMKAEHVPVRRAQTPAQLTPIIALLDNEADRDIAWSLALTGMRPREYFNLDWEHAGHCIRVLKGKTESARRAIPVWAAYFPVVPQRTRGQFEGQWEKLIGARLDIYDLRRSFATWLEDAGVTRSRVKIYLGHAAGDVTGLYTKRELDAWLQEDAGRLDLYAGAVMRRALNAGVAA